MAWTKLAYQGTTDKGNESDKVWKVQVSGSKLTTIWGKNKVWLRKTEKTYASPAKAKAAREKMVAKKKAKGYGPTRVTFKATGLKFKAKAKAKAKLKAKASNKAKAKNKSKKLAKHSKAKAKAKAKAKSKSKAKAKSKAKKMQKRSKKS